MLVSTLSAILILQTGVRGVFASEKNPTKEIATLISAGRINPALLKVNDLLKKTPDDPEARFLKALIMIKMDRNDEAIDFLEELIRDFPGIPEPYNNLAVLYVVKDKIDKARQVLLKAVEIDPNYAAAYRNLGDLYATLAASAYEDALKVGHASHLLTRKLDVLYKMFDLSASQAASVDFSSKIKKEVQPPEKITDKRAKDENEPPATGTGDENEKIIKTLREWAEAWSSKRVNTYFTFYDKDYRPSNTMNHNDWMEQRRKRINLPALIKITK